MADALDVEMPELPDDDGTTKMSIISSNGTNTFADDKDTVENGIWEDEDARSFYEKLADLKVLVPGVLLESAIKKDSVKDGKTVNDDAADVDTEVKSVDTSNRAAETEGEKEDKLLEKLEHLDLNDMDNDEADAEPESEVVDVEQDNEANVAAGAVEYVSPSSHLPMIKIDSFLSSTLADKDDAEDAANGGTGIKSTQMVQLEALLARLPTLNNRDMIDSVAVEFCYLNSKSARKRLIKVGYVNADAYVGWLVPMLIFDKRRYFLFLAQGLISCLIMLV
jgi:regulator of nonsense transcripts 2